MVHCWTLPISCGPAKEPPQDKGQGALPPPPAPCPWPHLHTPHAVPGFISEPYRGKGGWAEHLSPVLPLREASCLTAAPSSTPSAVLRALDPLQIGRTTPASNHRQRKGRKEHRSKHLTAAVVCKSKLWFTVTVQKKVTSSVCLRRPPEAVYNLHGTSDHPPDTTGALPQPYPGKFRSGLFGAVQVGGPALSQTVYKYSQQLQQPNWGLSRAHQWQMTRGLRGWGSRYAFQLTSAATTTSPFHPHQHKLRQQAAIVSVLLTWEPGGADLQCYLQRLRNSM